MKLDYYTQRNKKIDNIEFNSSSRNTVMKTQALLKYRYFRIKSGGKIDRRSFKYGGYNTYYKNIIFNLMNA